MTPVNVTGYHIRGAQLFVEWTDGSHTQHALATTPPRATRDRFLYATRPQLEAMLADLRETGFASAHKQNWRAGRAR